MLANETAPYHQESEDTEKDTMSKVKVAVRVRPLNHRELDQSMKSVINMRGNQTILQNSKKGNKMFAYDHCFLSMDENNPRFASQEHVFESLGLDVLDNAFEGYNACIFAYGQTGSGKSYTMMGSSGQKGLIPRLCDMLFDRIQKNEDSRLTYKVEVSYMEIYNERVRDLLDPRGGKKTLKVREHTSLGPYVDGLSKLAVKSFRDIDSLMSEGNKSRTVASTNMNSESSRSHAVFTVLMTQTMFDPSTMAGHEKVSRISLVDLAGSERLSKTGAEGDRLKEGSNINKSLSTLGLVISSLADQSSGKAKKGGFVPYRDSVLTWLLKDSLGGNSKTVMVATISPADDNYEETLSTLRYADRAKRIVNHAIINEDPNAKVVRELREELDRLRLMLKEGAQSGGMSAADQQAVDELKEKLSISERLMTEMTMTWEEKLTQTERIHKERQKALEEMGISIQAGGIGVESGKFYLVNINADPSLNELLVYYLRVHTRVGRPDTNHHPDIQLMGLGILPDHCFLDIKERDLFITPAAPNARTFINGHPVTEETLLYQGDRILWGNNHFFRVSCDRKRESTSSEATTELVDYDFARKEIAMHSGDVDSVVKSLEEKHTADKQGALDEQRAMYEKKLAELRDQMASQLPSVAIRESVSPETTLSTSVGGSRADIFNDEEEEKYSQEELARLKECIISAMELVREANSLAEEMGKQVKFKVSLQIPKACLSPRRRGYPRLQPANEVVVSVTYDKNKSRNTVWSVMKLDDKLINMREMYQRLQDGALMEELNTADPFFDLETHTLIGVANVFLECLHHDVPLEYSPPIIDPRGVVCGRLKVEIKRVQFPAEGSLFEPIDTVQREAAAEEKSNWAAQVSVIETTGLPPELSNFVFCQYNFYEQPNAVVPPVKGVTGNALVRCDKVVFDHNQVFCVPLSEEFIDYIAYGCLSIEVFGHRSLGFGGSSSPPEMLFRRQTSRTLGERWSEVLRRFEMFVEFMEIDETGKYCPVNAIERQDNRTGGIFLLKQGQSRRIKVTISPVKGSGSGPVAFEHISKIAIGAVIFQNKQAISLDSHMDSGLMKLRKRWTEALMRRRSYLDEQIHKMIDKSDRHKEDTERESAWIDEWTMLQWERAAVESPQRGSGVPGAVSARDKHLSPEMEKKICTVFLDLENELQGVGDGMVVGEDWLLDGEDHSCMIEIPVIKRDGKQVSAVASWDSSVHENAHLNKATSDKDRIYLVLKVTAQMSHPLPIQLVLRKRVCMKIYKKTGLGLGTTILKKFGRLDTRLRCGIVYEVAAGIPKQAGMDRPSSPDPERMLAAAEDEREDEVLGRYSHGVASVQSILALDKLRQEVAVKEKLAEMGRPLKKLPAPIPPKPLVSLSRADSGLLDTLALGDNTEDETARSPTESHTRGVSPGRLASAISSLEEVPETPYDESTLSVRTADVSLVRDTIPEIEIENEHREIVREVQLDQPVFSPRMHTSTVFENDANPRTSTPVAKPASGNETTASLINKSVPSSSSKVKEIIGRLPNDVRINGTNAQVEPQFVQLSLNDAGSTEVVDNRNPANETSENSMINQPESSQSDQCESQVNKLHFESRQPEDQLPHPSLNGNQRTQQCSLNQLAISEGCVLLPESEISQSKSQSDPELQSGSCFIQTVQSVAQSGSQIGQQSTAENKSESQVSQLIQSESEIESGQTTGTQNDVQASIEAVANAEESAEAQPVETETSHNVEQNKTSQENAESVVEEEASPHQEIDVPKELSDQGMQNTDEHAHTENLPTSKPTLPVEDETMQQIDYQIVEDKDYVVVTADPKIDSKDKTPNLVKETKPESCDAVKVESMNSSNSSSSGDKVQLQEHGHVVYEDTTGNTKSLTKSVENNLDKFDIASPMIGVASSSLQAPSKQNFSSENQLVDEKAKESSQIEVHKTIESEEPEQNEDKEESQANSRENREQITVTSQSVTEATNEQHMQNEPSESTSTTNNRSEHETTGLKRDEADQMREGSERDQSSTIERVENQDSGITRSRAETPSETSDSGSVASSTDLLDEPTTPQRRASDTPPVEPAVVADSKPKQTVTVGEVVMADLGKQGYKMGVVKFVGETQFQSGEWVGVALDRPNGKHNGSVQGVSYFKCKQKHGVFVRLDKIMKAPDLSASKSSMATSMSVGSVSRSPGTTKKTVLSGRKGLGTTAASSFKHKRGTGLK